jgi:hypothetical protein
LGNEEDVRFFTIFEYVEFISTGSIHDEEDRRE